MKAKVKISFRDKYTDELYKIGDVIEVTEERFDEILSVGDFIETVSTKGRLDRAGLEGLKKDELIKLAEEMELDATGTKADIIDRIVAEEVEFEAVEE